MAGNIALGYACCLLAGFLFGTNMLPVKKLDCGDGVFFSFCMSIGIIFTGLVLSFAIPTDESDAFRSLPPFEPYAMLGGISWAVGNFLCPTIIKWIGLGVGLTVWDLTNMLLGWASGFFGLLGVQKQAVRDSAMNFVGFTVVLLSLFVFTQARDRGEVSPASDTHAQSQHQNGASKDVEANSDSKDDSNLESRVSGVCQSCSVDESVAKHTAKISDLPNNQVMSCPNDLQASSTKPQTETAGHFSAGFALALLAGSCFGITFDPAVHLSQVEGRQQINYLWSSLVGAFLASTAVFVCYILCWGEQSHIPRALVIPGMLSGAMWAVAQTAWFEANQQLTLAIAFPVVCSITPLVSLVVGVFWFGELRTLRGRGFASAGLLVRLVGIALITSSS